MNEEILNNIWSHLTEKGLTQSDFDTWKTNVSGSSDVQANIHSYLIDSELTSSDFDTWANNAGLKKKEETELVSDSQEEITESTTEVGNESTSQASVLEEEVKTPSETEVVVEEQIPGISGTSTPGIIKDPSMRPASEVEQEVFTESISEINKDSDLKNIQQTTMRKVVGTDPLGS